MSITNLRHLTTPLLATGLLLSTLGCSKKEEPGPASNTGSYKLNGSSVACQARTSFKSYPATPGFIGQDELTVNLTTTPQPATGREVLTIAFVKNPGQPATAYQIDAVYLYNAANPKGLLTSTDRYKLSATSTSVSGTFVFTGIDTPHTLITDGVFTDVRL